MPPGCADAPHAERKPMNWLDLLLALVALPLALALRPWRALHEQSLPWPVMAWWALLPLLWSADRSSAVTVLQPLSGVCLLLLTLGWPLTVLMVVPIAAALLLTGMPAAEALHRGVWLGLVPATLALGLGAALRRWLPNHLFVYILGRGFLVTALAVGGAGVLSVWLFGTPPGLTADDLMLARGLTAWGDAFLTGMMAAIFVAFRPSWLATYADRIYLPRD